MINKTTQTIYAAAMLAAGLAAAPAQAADESLCSAPGITILQDPTGDVNVEGLAPASVPVSMFDLVSVQAALDDSGDAPVMTFTIKAAGAIGAGGVLPPNSAWFVSFKSADNKFYGVRMSSGATVTPTFESYTLGESNGGTTDGRFADVITPASGSLDSDTITIVVPGKDIGITRLGTSLTQFNSGAMTGVGAAGVSVLAVVLDSAPDDLSRRGSLDLDACATADAPKSGVLGKSFGGALGLGLLLPLMGIAGLRRRRG